MPRTTGLLPLLVALALAGCDAPGTGWPSTETIDEDVTRIQELARQRVAAGEDAPSGPMALAIPTSDAADEPVDTGEPAEPEPLVPDAARGAKTYALNCGSCHGAEGAGDGPAGLALVPPPTNHTDGAYMNPLSNDHLYKVVAEGGAAVGKSVSMAPWGGVLNEAQIWDVIAHMRALASPPYEGTVP